MQTSSECTGRDTSRSSEEPGPADCVFGSNDVDPQPMARATALACGMSADASTLADDEAIVPSTSGYATSEAQLPPAIGSISSTAMSLI